MEEKITQKIDRRINALMMQIASMDMEELGSVTIYGEGYAELDNLITEAVYDCVGFALEKNGITVISSPDIWKHIFKNED